MLTHQAGSPLGVAVHDRVEDLSMLHVTPEGQAAAHLFDLCEAECPFELEGGKGAREPRTVDGLDQATVERERVVDDLCPGALAVIFLEPFERFLGRMWPHVSLDTGAATDPISTKPANDQVIAKPALTPIITGAEIDTVTTRQRIHHIGPGTREDPVSPRRTTRLR